MSDSSKSEGGFGEAPIDAGSGGGERAPASPAELPVKAKPRIRLQLKKASTHPHHDVDMGGGVVPMPFNEGANDPEKVEPRMYGRPIPRHKGRCAGCLGSRDANALHEAILLCDGQGCTREYHIGCVEPPLTEIPEGEFYCFDCDPDGATRHLRSYFEDLEEERADYGSSREFVEHLLQVQIAESDSDAGVKKKTQQQKDEACGVDSLVEGDGIAAEAGRKRKRSFSVDCDESMGERVDRNERIGISVPPSELSKISQLHYAALKEVIPLDEENFEAVMPMDIGPDVLVGKLIRLYCPADNNYHTGRIVDWRSASNMHFKSNSHRNRTHVINNADQYHGKGMIASSEFLVRFAPGTEGRKTLLLQWLILEEHSLAVSSTIIWGQLRKGRGLSGWRPAQTLIRTSLELVPVRHLLETEVTSEHFSLALFFGEEAHVYLRLRDEAVDFFSPTFAARLQGSVLNVSSSGSKIISSSHAFCNSNQSDVSVSLALLEVEEQKRACAWQKLPLQNAAHRKALRLKDEFAIPPLVFCAKKDYMKQTQECGNKVCVYLKSECEADNNARPKLCPLIQHGLDKLWLAHLLGGNKTEKSVDTLESTHLKHCPPADAAVVVNKQMRGTAPNGGFSTTMASL